MIQMRNLGLCLLAFTAVACSKKGNGSTELSENAVTISGKLENAPAQGLVILEEFQEKGAVPVDTFTVSNNAFSEKVKLTEPGFYRLNLYDQQQVVLVLAPNNETVRISTNLADAQSIPKVEGSTHTRYMQELDKIAEGHQQQTMVLQQQFEQAQNEGNTAQVEALRQQYIASEQKMREQVKAKLRGMESSVAAVYAVRFLNREEDFPFLDSLATRLKQDIPQSKYVNDFAQGMQKMRSITVGQTAPEIALPNPEGEVKKLSDLRGKVVMIDFWAAWCGPCRRENPNVVRLYNQYKDQGFEVFGVSLDRSKDQWLAAIAQDGLSWTQVSDLKYFNSEAAQQYDVQAIPATVLLDREGKIIARNLRGEALEAKLSEIFGKAEAK